MARADTELSELSVAMPPPPPPYLILSALVGSNSTKPSSYRGAGGMARNRSAAWRPRSLQVSLHRAERVTRWVGWR